MNRLADWTRWFAMNLWRVCWSRQEEMTVLISSHELGEIDGVATHVAFLDEGKLLFEESMSDLSGRFREVHVTVGREASAPAPLPKNWLHVRAAGSVLLFVDSQFSEDGLGERIGAVG